MIPCNARAVLGCFGALLSACVQGIVIDEQSFQGRATDGSVVADDAGGGSDPSREEDAGTPSPRDGSAPAERDASADASSATPDASQGEGTGPDAGDGPRRDAGGPRDAGSCVGSRCEGGTLPGPCAACEVITLIAQKCDGGGAQVCWTEPDGECSYQCPSTGVCTRDDPDGCGPDSYCYFPDGVCGGTGAGYCARRPLQCEDVNVSICACDGFRYDNPCFARMAGSDARRGEPSGCAPRMP